MLAGHRERQPGVRVGRAAEPLRQVVVEERRFHRQGAQLAHGRTALSASVRLDTVVADLWGGKTHGQKSHDGYQPDTFHRLI